ncbi:ABC transporter ATP-binding protein [Leifsonia sp. YAF41]|uniref:ABC transporter ATP-binding protein n=1 Tax=Leifsonia sp. YAF41 TaxID=3233086 RepID=UPI003F94FFCB
MTATLAAPRVARRTDTLTLEAGAVHFAGVKAVDGVSLSIASGEVVGLIGPNGSGKTTTLNLISGMLKPTSGTITLNGKDVSAVPMRKRARLGIVRTFQSVRVFGRLTVSENIEAAALGGGLSRRNARALTAEILAELQLEPVADTRTDASPAGLIRRIGIARALASQPKFLLLDEPAAGQNESEAVELIEAIRHISQQRGCGVLLVEHDMSVVMGTCDRLHVLDSGKTVIEGLPHDIRSNPQVVEIYFGKRH